MALYSLGALPCPTLLHELLQELGLSLLFQMPSRGTQYLIESVLVEVGNDNRVPRELYLEGVIGEGSGISQH